ncbi:MAG: AAA family ATPase, partial [Planctomycetota bacterium]
MHNESLQKLQRIVDSTTPYDKQTSGNENPFAATPAASRYLPVGSVETARQTILAAIDDGHAACMVIGPPGTGKTVLCSVLIDTYREDRDVISLGQTPIESPAALLQNILFGLRLDFSGRSEGELRLTLIDHLAGRGDETRPMLIVVDESQSLPTGVLEELRRITNIVRDGRCCVQIVLAGGSKLDETFTDPSLESMNQRIAARCYLYPMNPAETQQYIHTAIGGCGIDPDQVIEPSAIESIQNATVGVPRLVNQMMQRAIDVA